MGNIKLSGSIVDQEAWIGVSYQNSWVNYGGATYAPVTYFKDKNGMVHLRGLMKSGTCGSTAFTLPAGYRPAYRLIFPSITASSVGRLDVLADGTVLPDPTMCNNLYFSVEGVTFRAEQ